MLPSITIYKVSDLLNGESDDEENMARTFLDKKDEIDI